MSSPSVSPTDRFVPLTRLAKRWKGFNDLTRAEVLAYHIRAGISRRQLALTVGCSESMIRYWLNLTDATHQERKALRKGKVTTRALITQIQLRRSHEAAEQLALEAEREAKEVEKIPALILQWLDAEKFAPPYALSIVCQAKFVLLDTAPEEVEELRRLDPSPTTPPLFERPPAKKLEDASDEVEGFATMLARWLIRGWNCSDVWFNALAVAGRDLEKRVPLFVQPTAMACEPLSE
jgi:hypothetical protein